MLYKLTGHLPCRVIELDSGPYLERYYLGQLFGVTFYLHRFVSSDSEKHIHNHPWEWGASVILRGGYTEERAVDICPHAGGSGCVTEMIERRWFNRVDGNTFHRIHNAQPGTWSLFFHGPRATLGDSDGCARILKGWGFLDEKDGTTVFTRAASGALKWWESAPLGRDLR